MLSTGLCLSSFEYYSTITASTSVIAQRTPRRRLKVGNDNSRIVVDNPPGHSSFHDGRLSSRHAATTGGRYHHSPSSLSTAGCSKSLDKCFDEAQLGGVLVLKGRRLKQFPCSVAAAYDLSDCQFADLSKNRLSEVPAPICELPYLETLNISSNCLRCIPLAVQLMDSLTYLDLSRNQLQTLPAALFSVPLEVLLLAQNRLEYLPRDIRALSGTIKELDISCNRLTYVPQEVGELSKLRVLNLRENLLTDLPSEVKLLQLKILDISSNHIAQLPLELRRVTTLVELHLENNPLVIPSSNLCPNGRVHVFKALEQEALCCGKGRNGMGMHSLGNSRYRDRSAAPRLLPTNSDDYQYLSKGATDTGGLSSMGSVSGGGRLGVPNRFNTIGGDSGYASTTCGDDAANRRSTELSNGVRLPSRRSPPVGEENPVPVEVTRQHQQRSHTLDRPNKVSTNGNLPPVPKLNLSNRGSMSAIERPQTALVTPPKSGSLAEEVLTACKLLERQSSTTSSEFINLGRSTDEGTPTPVASRTFEPSFGGIEMTPPQYSLASDLKTTGGVKTPLGLSSVEIQQIYTRKARVNLQKAVGNGATVADMKNGNGLIVSSNHLSDLSPVMEAPPSATTTTVPIQAVAAGPRPAPLGSATQADVNGNNMLATNCNGTAVKDAPKSTATVNGGTNKTTVNGINGKTEGKEKEAVKKKSLVKSASSSAVGKTTAATQKTTGSKPPRAGATTLPTSRKSSLTSSSSSVNSTHSSTAAAKTNASVNGRRKNTAPPSLATTTTATGKATTTSAATTGNRTATTKATTSNTAGPRPTRAPPEPPKATTTAATTTTTAQKPVFARVDRQRPRDSLGTAKAMSIRKPLNSSSNTIDAQAAIANMRQALQSRLGVDLPSGRAELSSSLSDGVHLCQFLNQLRVRAVPSVHTPMASESALSAPKCRRNVENFLAASRRLGVPESQLCSQTDLMERRNLPQIAKTVAALLKILNTANSTATTAANSTGNNKISPSKISNV